MVQILLKSSPGYSLLLRMWMDCMVEDGRARIGDRDGISTKFQLLECAGQLMEDDHRLSDYPLCSGCAVYMRKKETLRSDSLYVMLQGESADIFAKRKQQLHFGENPVEIMVRTPLRTAGNLDG